MAAAAVTADGSDHKVKLLIIGDSGVGKTALLLRFSDNTFSTSMIATIGVDFKYKCVTVDDLRLRLQIWDTAGQERYRGITDSFYRGCMGIMVVYDVTCKESFASIKNNWIPRIDSLSGEEVRLVLVANKCDKSRHRVITRAMGESLAEEYGIAYVETSARSGDGVEESFMSLARDVKRNLIDPLESARAKRDNVVIGGVTTTTSKKGGCCS